MKDISKNYLTIQGWMIQDLKLSSNSLLTFALIYGFCQDNESEFTGSINYICTWLNCTRPTVSKALNELVGLDLIIKTEKIINGVQFNSYKINLQGVNKFIGSKENLQGGSKENLQGGSKENLHNNTNNIYNNINNNRVEDFFQKSNPPNFFSLENFKISFFENSENYDFDLNFKNLRKIYDESKNQNEREIIKNAGNWLNEQKEKRKVPEKEKRKNFVKPTFDELLDYFKDKNVEENLNWSQEKLNQRAKDFLNFYESNGWKVGKNQMKNWKSAVSLNWIKDKYEEKNETKSANNNTGQQMFGRNTEEIVRKNLSGWL